MVARVGDGCAPEEDPGRPALPGGAGPGQGSPALTGGSQK